MSRQSPAAHAGGGEFMAKALTPDICVIGGGPGALAVATGAAAYGAKVIMIDRNTGAATRGALRLAALAAAAKQAQALRDMPKFGLAEQEAEIEFKALLAAAEKTAARAAPDFSPERLATLGVTVLRGDARFIGRRRLVAGDSEIRARRFVLATGSKPVVPPLPGLEEVGYLTAETIFDAGKRPGHLVVIGGDADGLALGQAFRRLGSQVSVLAGSAMLPGADPEMAAVVMRKLRAEGVSILEGVTVTGIERRGKTGVRVRVDGEGGAREVDGSHILLASGNAADVAGLDLKKARVATKGDAADVSAMLRTTNRRIYAIGAAAGAGASAHAAEHQAELVLKPLLFRLPAKDRAVTPEVTRTDPPIARAGLTEEQARKRHRHLRILRWPYSENDRARGDRATEGHIKLVASRHGELLGVTIAGAGADEQIALWALALAQRLSLEDMAGSIPPHMAYSEIGKKAAMSYFAGQARKPLIRGIVRFLRIFG